MSKLVHTPPHLPSADEVKALFSKYDQSGDGQMDGSELLRALDELGVLVLDASTVEHALALPSGGSTRELLALERQASSLGSGASKTRQLTRLAKLKPQTSSARRRRLALTLVERYDSSGDQKLDEKVCGPHG